MPLSSIECCIDGSQADFHIAGITAESLLFIEVMRDEVRDHFRISLGTKDVPDALQLSAQGIVILDDSVVDQNNFAVAAEVRVRVDVGCFPVSRPSRVTDADRAVQRLFFEELSQLVDASDPFPDLQAAIVSDSDSRTVVASIFQPVQSFQQQFRNRAITNVANNSTHGLIRRRSENEARDPRWWSLLKGTICALCDKIDIGSMRTPGLAVLRQILPVPGDQTRTQ